jgi:hypothetical protein
MEKHIIYSNKVDFEKALAELKNIISCQFNYKYNFGYIVVNEQGGGSK